MQNRSNIYTINDAAPPSYAEATGVSTPETYDLQLGQRYPHMVANTSPSVPPIQSVQQEYVLAERQSADIIIIRRTERTRERSRRTRERNQWSIFLGFILFVIICAVVGLGISYIR